LAHIHFSHLIERDAQAIKRRISQLKQTLTQSNPPHSLNPPNPSTQRPPPHSPNPTHPPTHSTQPGHLPIRRRPPRQGHRQRRRRAGRGAGGGARVFEAVGGRRGDHRAQDGDGAQVHRAPGGWVVRGWWGVFGGGCRLGAVGWGLIGGLVVVVSYFGLEALLEALLLEYAAITPKVRSKSATTLKINRPSSPLLPPHQTTQARRAATPRRAKPPAKWYPPPSSWRPSH